MNKRLIAALVLIGVAVIVMVLNRGSVEVNLIVTQVGGLKSLVFLGFTALGVVIGALLK
jgi:hypothetical protein